MPHYILNMYYSNLHNCLGYDFYQQLKMRKLRFQRHYVFNFSLSHSQYVAELGLTR